MGDLLTLEAAVEEIQGAASAQELLEVLCQLLGVTDPQRLLGDLERLEVVKAIYADPQASALDIFDAKRERLSTVTGAQAAFMDDPVNRELVRREDAISGEAIKAELLAKGAIVADCLEEGMRGLATAAAEALRCKEGWDEISRSYGRLFSETMNREIDSHPALKEFDTASKQIDREMEVVWAAFPAGDCTADPSLKDRYEAAMSPLREKKRKLYRDKDSLLDAIRKKAQLAADRSYGREVEAAKEAYAQAQQAKIDHENQIFTSVTGNLASNSAITEEQAQAWAAQNVFVATNAANKLRRIGYPPEALRKDIAELYRHVGGKVGPVEFVLEGRSKRAYARGKSLISIQGNFSKPTLFHECGHLVEHWDEAFALACHNFIENRATGSPVKLKTLTGINYAANEKAYPDSFLDPYVGKIYGHGSTEVVSMGLQCLSSPQALAALAQKDPEHLKLILGVCSRNNPFLKTKLEQASVVATAKAKEQTKYEVWQKALAKVSGTTFGKLLDARNGGYKGFKIEAYGRGGSLFPTVRLEEERWVSSIHVGKVPDLRAVAYLLIAHAEGLLLKNLSATEAQKQAVWLVRQGNTPDWFDPETPLPKV